MNTKLYILRSNRMHDGKFVFHVRNTTGTGWVDVTWVSDTGADPVSHRHTLSEARVHYRECVKDGYVPVTAK